jgi:hypothetical protein
MVKMVDFMLGMFYHNKKIQGKENHPITILVSETWREERQRLKREILEE